MKLISAKTYRHAKQTAETLELMPHKWLYIPWEPDDERRYKLAGLLCQEEDLIGVFSNEERALLLR